VVKIEALCHLKSDSLEWFPHHVCKQALAHNQPNAVERAYQRGDLFEKRRKLMAEWAKYCAAPVSKTASNVTPLRRKAKAS
jgi:hypothetical protein